MIRVPQIARVVGSDDWTREQPAPCVIRQSAYLIAVAWLWCPWRVVAEEYSDPCDNENEDTAVVSGLPPVL